MGDFTNNGFLPYEEKKMAERVSSFLLQQEGETFPIEYEYSVLGKPSIRLDLFLSQGIPSLKISGPTAIIFKSRIGASTPHLYYTVFFESIKEVGVSNLILIYGDKNEFSTPLLQKFVKFRKNGFYIYSISTFCKGETKKREPIPLFPDESYDDRRNRLINNAHYALVNGKSTLFIGAGLSCTVAVPQWKDFLSRLLGKNQAGSIGEDDFPQIGESFAYSSIITGRYIENRFPMKTDAEKQAFKEEMYNVLYENNPVPDSDLFKELKKIIFPEEDEEKTSVNQVITFNYDDLLETALGEERCQSIFNRASYTGNLFPVYHVHGMIPQKRMIDSTPILGEQEYHQLYKEAYHWSNVVQLFALSRTTCFFIGLSMIDPNLRRLLDISINGVGLNNDNIESLPPQHYAIMERRRLPFKNGAEEKNIEYVKNMERMMEQLGINIIWYDNPDGNHHEVPEILRRIRTGL